jgi:photosystem II stability/assembly factor-like uncharacterized protein
VSRDERGSWFLNRWARPDSAAALARILVARQSAVAKTYTWAPIGPANIGGRVTALAADPLRPGRVWIGTAGGGLWYSEGDGIVWRPQTDSLRSLSIGAIALHPGNADLRYLGTGEANLTLDSYPGCGIFRQTSDHDAWCEIGSKGLPNRIGAIAVDPLHQGRILVGSATIVDDDVAGLHIGTLNDAGEFDWEFIDGFLFKDDGPRHPGTSGPYRCHSIVFHPTEPNIVFVTVHLRGWRSGIYRSSDGGRTFTHLQTGLPSGEKFGRTSLAIGRTSKGIVLWAYAAHAREGHLGVFRSNDDGDSWQSVGLNHFANERSGDYSNCIAVHPKHPDWVICGGRDLHRTQDGGLTWQQITEFDAPLGDRHFSPGEHHALVITSDDRVYAANDGGVSFSTDFGRSWMTTSVAAARFFKIDIAADHADVIVGGLYHDGTVLHRESDRGMFRREIPGEGGWVLFDPDDSEHILATGPGCSLHRHTAAKGWKTITPSEIDNDEKTAVFLPVIAMDTSDDRVAPRPLLLGATRIWRSADDGETWRAVTVELDGSPVSALHICGDGSRRVYAGTEFGAFFASLDGGNTWSENLGGIDLPYRYITRIATLPTDPDHVIVTIGPIPPHSALYAHIYLSRDGGRTWVSADPLGGLPDAPHNCVVFLADVPFVATDFGVYRGAWADERQNYSWTDISGNLPNAFVMDLVAHAGSGTLTAATYGRGLFRHRLGSESDPVALSMKLPERLEVLSDAPPPAGAAPTKPPAPPPGSKKAITRKARSRRPAKRRTTAR